ncbi:MAG TPA: hypothetical protein VHG91_10390, partial [Longimicrobium sp.]|nr:hypothetical protein [Longimicrobium sp.]
AALAQAADARLRASRRAAGAEAWRVLTPVQRERVRALILGGRGARPGPPQTAQSPRRPGS